MINSEIKYVLKILKNKSADMLAYSVIIIFGVGIWNLVRPAIPEIYLTFPFIIFMTSLLFCGILTCIEKVDR